VVAGAPQRGKPSVKKFIRIGVDLAKNYFQAQQDVMNDTVATED
jgi:transposase